MSENNYLIVKLAAAGDVLLSTAMARELRRARPRAVIGWLTSAYAAPLLEANPDLDEVMAVPAPAGSAGRQARAAAACWAGLRRWRRRYGPATVLVAHRSRGLRALVRASGQRRVIAYGEAAVPFQLNRHRLQRDADLLRAAGVEVAAEAPLQPRLALRWAELAAGAVLWQASEVAHAPRWAVAPGGGSNPWASMPNRRWPRERFLELARQALAGGVELCWLGGSEDVVLAAWISEHLASTPAAPQHSYNYAGKLSLRASAAAIATADLVIGNDSLALVMAHALGRPALGIYGPTAGAHIHAPGQLFLQGRAGCGPCYDPRAGTRGLAYVCPRARCLEQISVEEVWRQARIYLPARRAYAAG